MSTLVGWAALTRLALRRDRVRLTVWVLALVGMTAVSGGSMADAFPTQRAIDSYARSVEGSPAVIAMSGPPIGLHTLGGVVLNKVSALALVGVVLVVVLTVVRHTRAEEEDGRAELLRSTVVGRHAASAAALAVAALVAVVDGAGTALAVAGAGVPTGTAWLFGASVTALGLVFAGVALVLAQVFTHARGATGWSLAVLGVAYVVRAAGDVREDFLVWLSPVGWVQAVHPLGDERWWPLLLPVVALVVLAVAAGVLTGRRDVGAGLVAARPGRATASARLAGPFGLATRLQRGALVGWGSGLFLLALATGSLSREVADMARDNPTLTEYLAASGQGSLTDAFFSTMLLVLALVAGAFAVSSALRLRAEEASGRLEVLLATGLSRTRWLLGSLAATVLGTLLLLAVSGLGLGLSYGLVVGDATQPFRLAGLALVYAPAAVTLAALAVLLVGWLPRATGVAWAVLGVCGVLGWLGGLLHPPRWLADLSPYTHTPAVPVASAASPALLVVALVAAALVGGGVVGLRRRDVATG